MAMDVNQAVNAALKDGNPNVRLSAAVMAGQTADQAFLKPLVELLQDKHWQVKEQAAWALGRVGAPGAKAALMRLLGATDQIVRKRILDTLGGQIPDEGSKGAPAKDDEPIQVKKAAALALARIDPDIVVNTLISALDSPNNSIKAAAIAGLGTVRAEAAADKLIEALSNEDPAIRGAAAAALGKLKAETAVDRLIELTEDEKWTVRQEALIALNHIKDDRAFDALAARLKDPRPEIRRVAVMAVGNTKKEEAVDLLRPFIQPDEKADIRRAAISSLSALNDVESLNVIAVGLSDQDEGVKSEAARAVMRLAERG